MMRLFRLCYLIMLFTWCHGISCVSAQNMVSDSAIWRALLHLQNQQPLVSSERFLVSYHQQSGGDFSSALELEATVALLNSDASAFCRFPARAVYLHKQGLLSSEPDFTHCVDYQEFLQKAPARSISVVYSSENLLSASSMMGHIMLKTEGTTASGLEVQHGVSFFTDIDSINFFKVMYESLVVGKEGFFQITPYQEKLDFYLNQEHRSVWEYELSLTDSQIQLLQAHFWELRSAGLPYFFHTYNCATVTQLILRIAYPQLEGEFTGWLSPLDVVKNINNLGVVKGTRVIPPNDWKMRMLQDALPEHVVTNVKDSVDNMLLLKGFGEDKNIDFQALQLAQTYNDYLRREGIRTAESASNYASTLDNMAPEEFSHMYMDLTDYKSPLRTPGDGQLNTGFYREFQQNWLFIEYVPAGRSLEDDNRQFFTENQLGVSSIRAEFNPSEQKLRLDHWHLYNMRSVVPFDMFSGGWSSRFKIGLEQHRNQELQQNLAFDVTFGTGLAQDLWKNGSVFVGVNAGLGYSRGNSYLYYYPEVGVFLYEIFNMKSTLLAQRYYNLRGESEALNRFIWRQSFFFHEDFSLVAEVERNTNSLGGENRAGLKLKYYY